MRATDCKFNRFKEKQIISTIKKEAKRKKIREAVVREQLSRRLNVKVGEMINTEIPF